MCGDSTNAAELSHRRVERELLLHRGPVGRVELRIGRRRGSRCRRAPVRLVRPVVTGAAGQCSGGTAGQAGAEQDTAGGRGHPAIICGMRTLARMELRHDPVDVVVLGLGPGGEYAARKLAEAGLDVVGVDKALVGGECPFWGCMPSKLMVRPRDAARRGAAGRPTSPGRPTSSRTGRRWRARIRRANHDWNDHHARRAAGAGGRPGRARPRPAGGAGPGRGRDRRRDDGVRGGTRRGAQHRHRARPGPPIDGLDGTPYWTNRDAMQVTELPDRAAGARRRARTASSWRRCSRGSERR